MKSPAALTRMRDGSYRAVLASHDQVGEQHPRDRAVCHPHSGIARGDVDVVGVHGVAADEPETILRFHDLARPSVLDGARRREVPPRPFFQ